VLVALCLGGCAQPGTQAPLAQARLLDEATSTIADDCGYAQEITASGRTDVVRFDRDASGGARKLLSVWRRDRSWIYQGESVNGIVSDSISLLGDCGLPRAQRALRQGIRSRR
jgi:hypothetical protein